jgi:hypothetical protein
MARSARLLNTATVHKGPKGQKRPAEVMVNAISMNALDASLTVSPQNQT